MSAGGNAYDAKREKAGGRPETLERWTTLVNTPRKREIFSSAHVLSRTTKNTKKKRLATPYLVLVRRKLFRAASLAKRTQMKSQVAHKTNRINSQAVRFQFYSSEEKSEKLMTKPEACKTDHFPRSKSDGCPSHIRVWTVFSFCNTQRSCPARSRRVGPFDPFDSDTSLE